MQGAREDRGWVGYFGSGADLGLGEEASFRPSSVCGGVASWEGVAGSDTVDLERETLHLMDDQRRVGMVETKTITPAGGSPVTEHRYQLNNHLGSAALEVDQTGTIITCEEYHHSNPSGKQKRLNFINAHLKYLKIREQQVK